MLLLLSLPVRAVPTSADMSAFALLEHADEDGYVENIEEVRELVESSKPAKAAKAKAKQQAGKAGSKATASNRSGSTGAGSSRAASNQQNDGGGKQGRAEDYYRAFQHVYKDTSTGVLGPTAESISEIQPVVQFSTKPPLTQALISRSLLSTCHSAAAQSNTTARK